MSFRPSSSNRTNALRRLLLGCSLVTKCAALVQAVCPEEIPLERRTVRARYDERRNARNSLHRRVQTAGTFSRASEWRWGDELLY